MTPITYAHVNHGRAQSCKMHKLDFRDKTILLSSPQLSVVTNQWDSCVCPPEDTFVDVLFLQRQTDIYSLNDCQ